MASRSSGVSTPGGIGSTARAQAIAAGGARDLTRLGGFTGGYIRLLRRAIRHPGKLLLAAVAALIAHRTNIVVQSQLRLITSEGIPALITAYEVSQTTTNIRSAAAAVSWISRSTDGCNGS